MRICDRSLSLVTFRYRVYGLRCASNKILQGLAPDDCPRHESQLSIEISTDPPEWVPKSPNPQACTSVRRVFPVDMRLAAGTGVLNDFKTCFELSYEDGTRFILDHNAERLWGTCPPSVSGEDLAVYLRGPVMGFVLRQRGILALHASAISIDGHAIVLCGPSESGKSTTAAALAMRGVPVLSDDIAALTNHCSGFYVEPGYPRICLWPDAVSHLCGSPDALPRLTPDWEKCFLPLDGDGAAFDSQRGPLSAIYFLGARVSEADAPRIEHLNSREGLLELVQNTYMNWLLDKQQRADEFDVLSRIAAEVPVRRIVPHADSARLGTLCDLILRDAEGLLSRQNPARMALSR